MFSFLALSWLLWFTFSLNSLRNATHTGEVPRRTWSYKNMIGSYWEPHIGEQHDDKKSYGFKEWMPWYHRGGSSVRASNFASNENFDHHYMGVVFHRGGIMSASTSESHRGTWSHRGMIEGAGGLDCFRAHIRLSEFGKSGDKVE